MFLPLPLPPPLLPLLDFLDRESAAADEAMELRSRLQNGAEDIKKEKLFRQLNWAALYNKHAHIFNFETKPPKPPASPSSRQSRSKQKQFYYPDSAEEGPAPSLGKERDIELFGDF